MKAASQEHMAQLSTYNKELKAELESERRIRSEKERMYSRQEDLTSSLIMNLGIELMKWK